jgi:hypothetical protein
VKERRLGVCDEVGWVEEMVGEEAEGITPARAACDRAVRQADRFAV